MDANLYEILTRLSENEFKTSRDLSKELSISDKTFRNRIKEINEIIEKYGASINVTIRMHTFGNLKMYKIDSAVIMILR